MKNVLLDKGIILPSGEISKDTPTRKTRKAETGRACPLQDGRQAASKRI